MKNKNSKDEKEINVVLKYHDIRLKKLRIKQNDNSLMLDNLIEKSEKQLKDLGYDIEDIKKTRVDIKGTNSIRKKREINTTNWKDTYEEAKNKVGDNVELESLFTQEELQLNREEIIRLNQEYDNLHKLDDIDLGISIFSGLLGATISILLVGIPKKTSEGLKGGPLSNYVRDWFNKKFPAEEMEKLANSKVSKVPFDAQDNRHTKYRVEGLSAYYHRLLSLSHDPFLGLIFGVYDIMNGTMTTIDKKGKFISQVMENYTNRKEQEIFKAIAKLIIHFKSDITTSMGLPAPLMGLFNLFQFGSIGEEEQTIAEIVQGMYYEGYDFIHFCSMSIPVMIIEVIVRLGYALKRIKEGKSAKESIPFCGKRDKKIKLENMLFIAHSISTAANLGQIYFTKNPMAINYPQWIAFVTYSYKQLKYLTVDKSRLRHEYVCGKINEELNLLYKDMHEKYIFKV